MHEGQVDVNEEQLRVLLRRQFPQWEALTIIPVPSSGTDNTIYRLGADLVVRLPLIEWAVRQVQLEKRWLPVLAEVLSVEVPTVVAVGEADLGYPWQWAVCRWIEGDNPHPDRVADPCALATDLAGIVRAIRSMDPTVVPRSSRGVPLRIGADAIWNAIEQVSYDFDAVALREAWADALDAPKWEGEWVPVHGDLSDGNLLVRDGRLVGLIDFSCFGLADPANDVDVAWDLFDGEARQLYRDALEVDDATWRRARGWAIKSVYGIPYYEKTNPGIVERARRRLHNVIADWRTENG